MARVSTGRSGSGRDHPMLRGPALVVVLLLAAVPLLPGQVPPVAAQDEVLVNHLRNPSFERSFDEPNFGPRPYQWSVDPWWPPEGTEIHQDHAVVHRGFFSAKVSSPAGTAPGSEVMWFQRLDLGAVGSLVGMGGWVWADLEEGAEASLRVRFGDMDAGASRTWELSVDADTGGWVRLDRAEAIPPTLDRVFFQCVLSGAGTVWFEDVWLGDPVEGGNPPFIVSVPPLEAAVGVEYTYRARAVDLEGEEVTFDLYRGPPGMTVSPDGDVNWTPVEVPEEAVKVVLRATDTAGLAGYQDLFLRVSEEPVQRPVHALLYSTWDDPFNEDLAGERYDVLLPMMGTLRTDHPDMDPTLTVLLGGADVRGAGAASTLTMEALAEAVEAGLVVAGYTALHEPTYDTSPLYDPSYLGWSWSERVSAIDGLLSRARDPLTGEALPAGKGGILTVTEAMGGVSVVAGVGADAAQLHALDRYDPASPVLGLSQGPLGTGAMVGDPHRGTLVSMLSEDPFTPYGVYWQGDRLQLDLDDAGTGPLVASMGPEGLSELLDGLDGRRVNVLPVLVADRGTYCNGSTVVSGDLVGSPTDWAWSHPSDPELPPEAVRPPAERQALYGATCSTLVWLAGGMLPATGGSFVSPEDLGGMVDPGSGIAVSAAELATASDDLIVRRGMLSLPDWAGVSWGFCRGDYQYFSLADMYVLLVQALSAYLGDGELPATVDLLPVRGPLQDAPPSQPYDRLLMRSVLAEAADQAEQLTDGTWRLEPRNAVPSTSSPGNTEVNAMEFLLLMAEAYMIVFERADPGNPLLNLFPTAQWPLTHAVLGLEGRVTDAGDSWNVKPASARSQQDDVPPRVRYVTPAPGSRDVALDSNVTVTFSERMDETADLTGAVLLDPPVAAEVRWLYHRLVLDPLGNLSEDTTYTATVGTSLRDAAGNPLTAEVTWSFSTVGGENLPPVLYPQPEDPAVEVEENRSARFSLFVEDDGPLPLAFEWWVDGVRVLGEAGDQFVLRTGYTDAGEHTVTVVVSDAAQEPGQSTFTWNLTVVNVNIPPVLLEVSPEEGEVELLEAIDGLTRFRVRARDVDEEVLVHTWRVNGEVVPGAGSVDGWSVLELVHDHESAGLYEVTCRVDDRVGEGFWVRWNVTVVDVNRAPVIVAMDPALPVTVDEGKAVLVEVNATDPDGDELSYVWYVDGSEAAETRAPRWRFPASRDGSFPIAVVVVDGRGGNATATTTVNVLPGSDVRPLTDPSVLPWLLLAVIAGAMVIAILWPRLRRGLSGDRP